MRTLTQYCEELPAVPPEYCCLWPELFERYKKLLKRYNKVVTKRSRIWALSEPRTRNHKFRAICISPDAPQRKVNIVRMEQPSHTRTEQLSYPQASRLMLLKESTAFNSFDKTRKEAMNCLLRKSVHSLYSRLSNIQPPKSKPRPRECSAEQWKQHLARIEMLAQPKKPPKSPEELEKEEAENNKLTGKKMEKPSKSLRRYKNLSRPKVYEDTSAKEWHLTSGMQQFNPSPRLLEISKPKIYPPCDTDEVFRVKPNALRYRATERINQMSIPVKVYTKRESNVSQFTVKPNALKAKVTDRILELAKPKSYDDANYRSNPFKVSPNALKAKITKRVNELAQPKKKQ